MKALSPDFRYTQAMNSFTLRRVMSEDLPQWRRLWDGYNAFYGRSGSMALPEAVTETTWARFFDVSEPVHALVATDGAQLIGLAHYLFHRSTSAIEPSCYLQDLFTDKAWRGKGVARALILEVYKAVKDAGVSRFYWHTHESNKTAQRLYDKIGHKSGFIVYRHMI